MVFEDKEYLREVFQTILDGDVGKQWSTPDLKNQPPGSEKEAWQKCSELVERYDKGMCEAYREQIDTLLVVAGLFSAVITAFTVESYQWLYDGAADESVVLLAQIASALSQSQNRTAFGPVLPHSATQLKLAGSAVHINTCWFLSLTLSLSAALVGILAKQWIREYERDAGRRHADALGIRQMKFKGLETWRVNTIVASVPLLLQAALVLFFVGVLELLWLLNSRVAIPVTIVACHIAAFYVATTLLPALQFLRWFFTPASTASQCPYKSPQAWLVLRAVLRVATLFAARKMAVDVHEVFGDQAGQIRRATELIGRAGSWLTFDFAWMTLSDAEAVSGPEHRYEALAWLWRTFDHTDLRDWIWHCMWACSKSGHLSPRSSGNIGCILGRDQPETGPGEPAAGGGSPATALVLPRVLMLHYAFSTGARPKVVLELLHGIHQTAQSRRVDFAAWTATWIDKVSSAYYLTEPVEPVDDEVCSYLLSLVLGMAVPARNPLMIGHTIHAVLRIMRLAPRSEARDRAILALCPLTRRWLQHRDFVEPAELRAWLDVATSVCAKVGAVFAAREPDARRERILAELACAIDHYRRCLGEHRDGARHAAPAVYPVAGWEPYLSEAFHQLVRVGREAWRADARDLYPRDSSAGSGLSLSDLHVELQADPSSLAGDP